MKKIKLLLSLFISLIMLYACDYEYGDDHKLQDMTAVDLGLSVKWASCNLGASGPTYFGKRYIWGHIDDLTMNCNNGCIPEESQINNISGTKYDAAKIALGNGWRIPTKAEFEELYENCKFEWILLDTYPGAKFTAPNGNSVFFPASGYYDLEEKKVKLKDLVGCYHCGELYVNTDGSTDYMYLDLADMSKNGSQFIKGRVDQYVISIRPVRE